MRKGSNQNIQEHDLYDLVDEDRPNNTVPLFEKSWEELIIDQSFREKHKWPATEKVDGSAAKGHSHSLLRFLTKVIGPNLFIPHMCKLIDDILVFIYPFLQRYTSDYKHTQIFLF